VRYDASGCTRDANRVTFRTNAVNPRRLHNLPPPAADAADRLLALAAATPLAGIERSCKFSRGSLHNERLLLGQSIDRLRQTPMFDAHLALGLPPTARTAYEHDRQAANFMYLGFDGGDQQLSYRIYLEFPVNMAQRANVPTGQINKALLARGYKWDALGSDVQHHDVTDYWWEPRLTVDQIRHRLDAIWSQQAPQPADEGSDAALDASRAVTRQAIELARQRSNALNWMYLEATEPNSTRHSFDLNLYEAELTLAELQEGLRTLAEALQIPSQDVDAFFQKESASSLGHLSGGLGRNGQPFLTVYYTDADA
jgi:tryptophan halogenase